MRSGAPQVSASSANSAYSRWPPPRGLTAMPKLEVSLDIQRVVRRLARLHRWVLRLVQVSMFLFAGISAFLLRFDFSIPRRFQQHLAYALCVWVLSKIVAFHLLCLDLCARPYCP